MIITSPFPISTLPPVEITNDFPFVIKKSSSVDSKIIFEVIFVDCLQIQLSH